MSNLLTKEQRERWARNTDTIRREMAMFDWTTAVNNAKREGRREGIKEAKREVEIEIAKKLLKKGTSLEDIAEVSNLDIETIQELQKQQG